jgi:hypothetical protein
LFWNWDYWIVKLDSLGTIQWQNTIGGSNEDELIQFNKPLMEGIYWVDSRTHISGDKTED